MGVQSLNQFYSCETSPLSADAVPNDFFLFSTKKTDIFLMIPQKHTLALVNLFMQKCEKYWYFTLKKCLIWIFVISSKLLTPTVITPNIGTDGPEQTVETQIRCHRMWHLIRFYTVCHLSSTILDISAGSKIDFFFKF